MSPPGPTDRLRFREMRDDDVGWLRGLVPREPAEWVAWTRRNYADHGFGLWVTEAHDGEVVGDCGLTVQDVEGTAYVEVGWHVRPHLRRQGYATEAGRAVLDAARAAGITHVVAIARPDNVASQGVATALGMGLERRAVVHGGDAVVFETDL